MNSPLSPSADSAPALRTEPSIAERRSRALALAALTALMLLCLGWELWWAPTGRGTLALKALPLVFPWLGLWRYRLYTFRWLSLLVWLYCAEGLVRGGSEAGIGRMLAWIEVALSVLLFIACAWQVRQRLAAARAASAAPQAAA